MILNDKPALADPLSATGRKTSVPGMTLPRLMSRHILQIAGYVAAATAKCVGKIHRLGRLCCKPVDKQNDRTKLFHLIDGPIELGISHSGDRLA